jgi:hypothetical protein
VTASAGVDHLLRESGRSDGGDAGLGGGFLSNGALSRYRLDVLWILVLALLTAVLTFRSAGRIDRAAFEFRHFDVYLQGDLPRTHLQMLTRDHNGARTALHPLYPFAVHPMTWLGRALFQRSAFDSVRLTLALFAAAWTVLLYLVARAISLSRADASLITLLGLAGASPRFWFVVPETFLLGGLALLGTVLVAAHSERRPLGDAWYVASGVAALGSTISNWFSGLLLALTTASLTRAIRIALLTLGVVTSLWIVERVFYPNISFIFDPQGVRSHLRLPDADRTTDVARVFFAHTAVAPRLEACTGTPAEMVPFFLSFQAAPIGSAGLLGVLATVAWFALLLLGGHALLRLVHRRKVRVLLAGSLVSQFLLHLVYGGETFLYSIHWWGLLVVVVALALERPPRLAVRGLAILFIVTAGAQNLQVWSSALPVFQIGAGAFPRNGRTCEE